MKLDKTQTRHLKALAHPLKPVVRIGQKGLTEGVIAEIDRALRDHELIKLKIAGDRDERTTTADSVCNDTAATLVSMIGGIAILFRRNTRKPKIEL